jgi:uncharacterized SAM-binding protein YcdF (DUF218 family)
MLGFSVVKALSILVNPLTQVIVLLGIGISLLHRNKLPGAMVFLTGSFLWLSLCSSPWAAGALMGRLEAEYPPMAAQGLPEADVIVLLGGAIRGRASPETLADMSDLGDRVLFAAAAFRAGKAPVVLVTGGGAQGQVPEASFISDILVTMGVPRDKIRLETRNRVTRDNSRFTSETLAAMGAKSILLVTSAFHMRRAMLVFEPLDIIVWPAATDYQVLMTTGSATVSDFIPSIKALQRTHWAMHELIGYCYYRLLSTGLAAY